MQNFSEEQLMQYLYGEASPILKLAIDKALKENTALQKEIKSLQKTKKALDKLSHFSQSPGTSSIDAIMQHAKRSQQKKN
jgi:anti-sigma factor RsiW